MSDMGGRSLSTLMGVIPLEEGSHLLTSKSLGGRHPGSSHSISRIWVAEARSCSKVSSLEYGLCL